MKYTLTAEGSQANTVKGHYIAIVPDEVAENQSDFDGKTFPILIKPTYGMPGKIRKGRGRLRGDLYGLNTPGTGDMVVAICG